MQVKASDWRYTNKCLYQEYYEKGDMLRVPHKQSVRERPLPGLESKVFEIDCIGNYKSTADIVFPALAGVR